MYRDTEACETLVKQFSDLRIGMERRAMCRDKGTEILGCYLLVMTSTLAELALC